VILAAGPTEWDTFLIVLMLLAPQILFCGAILLFVLLALFLIWRRRKRQ
jgi:hypothetical protein